MKHDRFTILFYIILVVVSLIFPVLGLLFMIPLYFIPMKGKKKAIVSILLGVLVGYFAYNFMPTQSFDLVRWQGIAQRYTEARDIGTFLRMSESIDLEIIPKIVSFIVSRFDNVDLLQFIMVTIGYSLLFYMLADYREKCEMGTIRFVIMFLLILFGQSTLYYFSGLYNYTAINIFAFAFYIDYVKKKHVLSWILYVVPTLIHGSMLLPLVLIIMFKCFGSRLNIKTVTFAILVPLIFVSAVSLLGDRLNFIGISSVQSILKMYMSNNEHYRIFYTGMGLVIDILKILLIFAICVIARKRKEAKEWHDFALIVSIVTILLLPISIVMIRFATLALFLGIVPIMDFIANKKERRSQYASIIICGMAILFAVFNIHTIYPYGYKGFLIRKIPTTMNEFLNKQSKGEYE